MHATRVGSDMRRIFFMFLFITNLAHIQCAEVNKQNLIKHLYEHGVIQLNDTVIKSGSVSPIYFDMRLLMSYPTLLQELVQQMGPIIETCTFDRICGVPYGALPLATALMMTYDYPMIMPRKEIKKYGMQKAIEGVFKKGDRCLVIEDVMSTGSSIIETIQMLKKEGIVVHDVVVAIDREQGGSHRVKELGCNVYAVFTMSEIISVLLNEGIIDFEQYARIAEFVRKCTQ